MFDHTLPAWADGPQDVVVYRRQLIKIVHKLMARPENGLAFILSAYENIAYSDILDYISVLPEEAVNEIIKRFSEGIPEDGGR